MLQAMPLYGTARLLLLLLLLCFTFPVWLFSASMVVDFAPAWLGCGLIFAVPCTLLTCLSCQKPWHHTCPDAGKAHLVCAIRHIPFHLCTCASPPAQLLEPAPVPAGKALTQTLPSVPAGKAPAAKTPEELELEALQAEWPSNWQGLLTPDQKCSCLFCISVAGLRWQSCVFGLP